MREALSRLKALGLVESRQGGGTYVRRPEPCAMPAWPAASDAGLTQLLEVRRMLEVGAAKLAARHRTAEDIGRLDRILAHMRESGGSEEFRHRCEADFRLAVARASGNAVLAALVEQLLRAAADGREARCCGGGETDGERLGEYLKLFAAIRDGDARRAAAAMADLAGRMRDARKAEASSGSR